MKCIIVLAAFLAPTIFADKYVLNCFDRVADHGVAGSRRPLAELWGVNAYDCLKWCIAATGTDIQAVCKAVVYHKHHWSCQVYGTDGRDDVGFRIPAYGHDLYVRVRFDGPLGNCSSAEVTPPRPTTTTTTTTPDPPRPICPTEAHRDGYLLFLGQRARLSGNGGAIRSGDEDELSCLALCDADDACRSANMRPAVGQSGPTCELLPRQANERQRGGGVLEPAADHLYAAKFCLAPDAYARCAEILPGQEPYIFPSYYGRRPGDEHFIRALDADDEDECVNVCIRERSCETAVYDFGRPSDEDRCSLYSAALLAEDDGVQVAQSVLSVENVCVRMRVATTCPPGRHQAYSVLPGKRALYELSPFPDGTGNEDYIEPIVAPITIRGVNPLECYRVCSNTGPGGPDVGDNVEICRSGNIVGTHLGQAVDCELHTIRAEPNGPVTLADDRSSLYIEKFCLPEHPAADDCFDEVFFVHLDKSIDAEPLGVEEGLETYHQCAERCVATAGCKTSTFDVTNGLCALFAEDIQSSLTPKFRQEGLYTLENGCLQNFKQRAAVFSERLAEFQSGTSTVRTTTLRRRGSGSGSRQSNSAGSSSRSASSESGSRGRQSQSSAGGGSSSETGAGRSAAGSGRSASRESVSAEVDLFGSRPDPVPVTTGRPEDGGLPPAVAASMPWTQWSPCQFTVHKRRVRVRSRQCQLADCPPGSLQVHTCSGGSGEGGGAPEDGVFRN